MEFGSTLQAPQLAHERGGAEGMASLSRMLLQESLRTAMAPAHTFPLPFLPAVEIFGDEQSRRKPDEDASVASAEEEEAFKVDNGAKKTFGNQTFRVKNDFGLLSAVQVKGDHLWKFSGQEQDFIICKAGDDSDLLPSPDTDVRLNKKDIAKWLMAAKKSDDDDDEEDDDDDDDDDDDEDEDDEHNDVNGEEAGGFDEGDGEDDENEDDEDAADDEDDGDGDGEDDDGDEEDDDDDDNDEDDDEDEDEEEEPPKKKSK